LGLGLSLCRTLDSISPEVLYLPLYLKEHNSSLVLRSSFCRGRAGTPNSSPQGSAYPTPHGLEVHIPRSEAPPRRVRRPASDLLNGSEAGDCRNLGPSRQARNAPRRKRARRAHPRTRPGPGPFLPRPIRVSRSLRRASYCNSILLFRLYGRDPETRPPIGAYAAPRSSDPSECSSPSSTASMIAWAVI
jgi:hypothetical protein